MIASDRPGPLLADRRRGSQRFLTLAAVLLLTTSGASTTAGAQSKPWSLDQVVRLLRGKASSDRVLELVGPDCISFTMDANAEASLRAAGAEGRLVQGLRSVCSSVAPPQPVPVPRPVSPSYPVASGALIDDNFSGAQRLAVGPSTDRDCDYNYQNGRYVIRNTSRSHTCSASYPGSSSRNVRIESSLHFDQGPVPSAMMLDFGVQTNPRSYWAFEVNNKGEYTLQHLANDVWTEIVPWSNTTTLRQGVGATNDLGIEIRGRGVTLFINGQNLGSYAIDEEPNGLVQLQVNGANGQLQVGSFDYLRISDIGSVNPAPAATTTLVNDDFRSSHMLPIGQSFGHCDMEYETGGYIVQNTSAELTCLAPYTGAQSAGIRVETTVTFLQAMVPQAVMIDVGYSGSPLSYYAFEINNQGEFSFSRYTNNAWQTLIDWQAASALRRGNNMANQLVMEVRGRSVALMINGQRVGSVEVDEDPVGLIAFATNSANQGNTVRARFSYLRVTGIQ